MSEPSNEDCSDYNRLEGSKREVVYAVIAALISFGILYSIVKEINSHVSDEILVLERKDLKAK